MSTPPPKPDMPPLRPRIPSPCIQICRLDPFEDVCVGCFRTADEIASWASYSDEQRRQIMGTLKERRATAKPRLFRPR